MYVKIERSANALTHLGDAHAEIEQLYAAHAHAYDPNEDEYASALLHAKLGLERKQNDVIPVQTDRHQRDNGHVHAKSGGKRRYLAEHVGKYPFLQVGGLELKGRGKQTDDHVGHGQITYEKVGDALHTLAFEHYDDYQTVSEH